MKKYIQVYLEEKKLFRQEVNTQTFITVPDILKTMTDVIVSFYQINQVLISRVELVFGSTSLFKGSKRY